MSLKEYESVFCKRITLADMRAFLAKNPNATKDDAYAHFGRPEGMWIDRETASAWWFLWTRSDLSFPMTIPADVPPADMPPIPAEWVMPAIDGENPAWGSNVRISMGWPKMSSWEPDKTWDFQK